MGIFRYVVFSDGLRGLVADRCCSVPEGSSDFNRRAGRSRDRVSAARQHKDTADVAISLGSSCHRDDARVQALARSTATQAFPVEKPFRGSRVDNFVS
jgi:hypothetical protein